MIVDLSCIALTLVMQYSMVSGWVIGKDEASISDVVPTMGTALWILAVISIILNVAPVFLELKNKN